MEARYPFLPTTKRPIFSPCIYLPTLQFCWRWPSLAAKKIWTESVKHEVLCDAFVPICENAAKANNRSQSFPIPSRWATWSLEGLGAKIEKNKNKNTVTAEHLCGEPQPMQWNGITDGGHWGEGCSTSEARDFNWIQRASFGTCLSWLNWPFPFPKAAWVLKLIGGENKSDEVAEEPPPVFLGRIYSLVPLFARYVDRIVVQQLLASLEKENIFSLPTEPASQKPNDLHFKGKHAFKPSGYADNEPGIEEHK